MRPRPPPEIQWVRARGCARVCVSSRVRCSPAAPAPGPSTRPRRPASPPLARPAPAPPPERSSALLEGPGSQRAPPAKLPGRAGLLRPPAGSARLPGPGPAAPSGRPRLLARPPSLSTSSPPGSDPEPSPRSPNLPGLRSMPSAARPAGWGVGRGRAGRDPAGQGGGRRARGALALLGARAGWVEGFARKRWVGRPGSRPAADCGPRGRPRAPGAARQAWGPGRGRPGWRLPSSTWEEWEGIRRSRPRARAGGRGLKAWRGTVIQRQLTTYSCWRGGGFICLYFV